jgi:hypothetical protein
VRRAGALETRMPQHGKGQREGPEAPRLIVFQPNPPSSKQSEDGGTPPAVPRPEESNPTKEEAAPRPRRGSKVSGTP